MFVSTRSTVPLTLARAAAWTFARVPPVSGCSERPLSEWNDLDGSRGGAGRPWAPAAGGALAAGDVELCDEPDVAAFAIVAPPTAAAATTAPVTSFERISFMCVSFQ